MESHSFEFLKSVDEELEGLGAEIDKALFSSPSTVLSKGRLLAEALTRSIGVKENMDYLTTLSQYQRISELVKEGLIPDEYEDILHRIRRVCNEALHEVVDNEQERALNVHRNVYYLASWYTETYGSDLNYVPKSYSVPAPKKSGLTEKEMQAIIDQVTSRFTREASVVPSTGEMVSPINEPGASLDNNESILANYPFQQLEGSYLLHELSKLKQSSIEAVEGCESLSEFKAYLHINRTIQDEFLGALTQASNPDSAQLVMLCGSVGDGKSHLLSYVNQHYPELTEKFVIHNDATESFDPNKDSLETLAEMLMPFSDSEIDKSTTKLILAINLGVLHNFLESKIALSTFKKLRSIVMEANIFDTNQISESFSSQFVNIVSFADFNLYELTETGVKSDYISQLLLKIVNQVDANPFFEAYRRDLTHQYHSAMVINYQLLMSQRVRDKIVQIIIQTFIENKKIISTRELFNFIYEILVPTNLKQNDYTDNTLDNLEMLLPNLLFNNSERSHLLSIIHTHDPINIRHQLVDQFLIDLDISSTVLTVIEETFDTTEMSFLTSSLSNISTLYDLTRKERANLISTLLRFGYFFGKQLNDVYQKESYETFKQYLYFYNEGVSKKYLAIYSEIQKAVYNWKGHVNGDFIMLNELTGSMKLSQQLKFNRHIEKSNSLVRHTNRFKSVLNISFKTDSGDIVTIQVDYKLYEAIDKINKGYCPNKKERENLLVFDEFIDRLMETGLNHDYLHVHVPAEKLLFKLEYEDLGDDYFKFERVNNHV